MINFHVIKYKNYKIKEHRNCIKELLVIVESCSTKYFPRTLSRIASGALKGQTCFYNIHIHTRVEYPLLRI